MPDRSTHPLRSGHSCTQRWRCSWHPAICLARPRRQRHRPCSRPSPPPRRLSRRDLRCRRLLHRWPASHRCQRSRPCQRSRRCRAFRRCSLCRRCRPFLRCSLCRRYRPFLRSRLYRQSHRSPLNRERHQSQRRLRFEPAAPPAAPDCPPVISCSSGPASADSSTSARMSGRTAGTTISGVAGRAARALPGFTRVVVNSPGGTPGETQLGQQQDREERTFRHSHAPFSVSPPPKLLADQKLLKLPLRVSAVIRPTVAL